MGNPSFTEDTLFYGIMHFNNVISQKSLINLDDQSCDQGIYCRNIAHSLYLLFADLLCIYWYNKSFGKSVGESEAESLEPFA